MSETRSQALETFYAVFFMFGQKLSGDLLTNAGLSSPRCILAVFLDLFLQVVLMGHLNDFLLSSSTKYNHKSHKTEVGKSHIRGSLHFLWFSRLEPQHFGHFILTQCLR